MRKRTMMVSDRFPEKGEASPLGSWSRNRESMLIGPKQLSTGQTWRKTEIRATNLLKQDYMDLKTALYPSVQCIGE